MRTIYNSSRPGCCFMTPSIVGAATLRMRPTTGPRISRGPEMIEAVTIPQQEIAAPKSSFPSLSEAVRTWIRVALLSFGGPAGQIAIMHRILVEEKRWISERRFLHALNYCMLLPGPEAQQLATYIGWLMHRTLGGIVAGGLFVAPSLIVMIALSWADAGLGDLPVVAGLPYGISPAVVAIVAHAAHRIGSRTLRNVPLWSI